MRMHYHTFTKQKIRRIAMLAIVLFLHLLAVALRWMNHDLSILSSTTINAVRGLIYLFLIICWGISIRYRMIVKSTIRYLSWTVFLMAAWIGMRSLKYMIENVIISRYLWYCYYIPIIFIPVLAIFVSLSIGERDTYVLPKTKWIPVVIGTILFLSVITNDLHQLVFSFPAGLAYADHDYHHELLYYMIVVWALLCIAHAVVVLLKKCRIQNTRRMLFVLLIPMMLAVLYCTFYVRGSVFIKTYMPDMTVFVCCFIVSLYECCILGNLIANNSQYEELFGANVIPMMITDDDYHVFSVSRNAPSQPEPFFYEMTPDNYVLKDSVCTYMSDITGGHVFWSQDVSQIVDVINQLEDVSESLQERHEIVQEEYRTNQKRMKLKEANRIYERMQLQTASQIQRMMQLIDSLEETQQKEEEERIAVELAMRGAYFKRRNNLLFIAETQDQIPCFELTYCLNESLYALQLNGVVSSVSMNLEGTIPFTDVLKLYDTFEEIIECVFPSISAIAIFIDDLNSQYQMQISLSSHTDDPICFPDAVEVEMEEEEYVLTYHLKKSEGTVL